MIYEYQSQMLVSFQLAHHDDELDLNCGNAKTSKIKKKPLAQYLQGFQLSLRTGAAVL